MITYLLIKLRFQNLGGNNPLVFRIVESGDGGQGISFKVSGSDNWFIGDYAGVEFDSTGTGINWLPRMNYAIGYASQYRARGQANITLGHRTSEHLGYNGSVVEAFENTIVGAYAGYNITLSLIHI